MVQPTRRPYLFVEPVLGRRPEAQEEVNDDELRRVDVDPDPVAAAERPPAHQSSEAMSGPPLVATAPRDSSAATSVSESPSSSTSTSLVLPPMSGGGPLMPLSLR